MSRGSPRHSFARDLDRRIGSGRPSSHFTDTSLGGRDNPKEGGLDQVTGLGSRCKALHDLATVRAPRPWREPPTSIADGGDRTRVVGQRSIRRNDCARNPRRE